MSFTAWPGPGDRIRIVVLGIVLGALIVLGFYHPLIPVMGGSSFPVAAAMLLIMIARLFSSAAG